MLADNFAGVMLPSWTTVCIVSKLRNVTVISNKFGTFSGKTNLAGLVPTIVYDDGAWYKLSTNTSISVGDGGTLVNINSLVLPSPVKRSTDKFAWVVEAMVSLPLLGSVVNWIPAPETNSRSPVAGIVKFGCPETSILSIAPPTVGTNLVKVLFHLSEFPSDNPDSSMSLKSNNAPPPKDPQIVWETSWGKYFRVFSHVLIEICTEDCFLSDVRS